MAIGPELILDPRFWKLWERALFRKTVSRIIVDEAHCIDEWGHEFRSSYLQLGRLYNFLKYSNTRIPWYLASATLDIFMLSRILHTLGMQPFDTTPHPYRTLLIARSNDRPNLHYVVRRMQYSVRSCQDLEFLVQEGLESSDTWPTRFLVYCNSRDETMQCAEFLRHRVAREMQWRIPWVHSGMSDLHRESMVGLFSKGELLGVVCTDALGMVCKLCTLLEYWQVVCGLQLNIINRVWI